MIASTRSRGPLFIWIGAFALGFVLRALPLTAARPYIAYVDEGNFLHSAFRLVKEGGWDPRSYLYPQFPVLAVVAAARVVDPIYRSVRGRSLRDRIPAQIELYDELEPFALLLIARCMSLALGLGTVALTGLLAMRLAGPRAGAAAALLAAVAPALVLRGSIATVDPYATIFVLSCLYFTDLTRTWPRAGLASFLAGAMAGGAFASKYPSVVVIAAFGVTTLLQRIAWRERLRRLCLSGLGLLVGAALAMPALLEHPGDVNDAIARQSNFYAQHVSPPLWKQAFLRAEWDIPYENAELGFVFLGRGRARDGAAEKPEPPGPRATRGPRGRRARRPAAAPNSPAQRRRRRTPAPATARGAGPPASASDTRARAATSGKAAAPSGPTRSRSPGGRPRRGRPARRGRGRTTPAACPG